MPQLTPHPSARALGLVLALLSAGALAHGKDGVHLLGTVKEVREGALVLVTREQATEQVMTDAKTQYERSGQRVPAAELKVGERAVVHATRMKDGHLHAMLVKFGKPAAKPAPAPAPAPPQP